MTKLQDRILALLAENPNITTEEAQALLPDANDGTVRSALSRLRNRPQPLTGESGLIAGITKFYTDGWVNLDEMMLMLRVVEARRAPVAMSAEQIKNSNSPEAQAAAREAMRAA